MISQHHFRFQFLSACLLSILIITNLFAGGNGSIGEFTTDDPPPPPALNPAEWEPMTGVLIRYPLGIPLSLVAEMAEDVEVMSIVYNSSQMQNAINSYSNYGVNMANCTFLISGISYNSPWTRDFGPWYIFDGDGEQGIIDFIADWYCPGDDPIPQILGDSLGIPVYFMPLIHVGGNYMSDGMGIAMSSGRVYDDNSNYTQAEVDEIMYEYLGIENYIIVPHYGGLQHIDTMAKLLDPGRIIVMRLDPPDPDVEAAAELLQTLMSPYGRPYEVLRIDGSGYTNTLFLNDKVLVPQFNSPYDEPALHTWHAAMPGYEVLGFYYSQFSSGDALHCRTMGITDRYMLRIVHIPLHDSENTGGDYLVKAEIHAYSNMPLIGLPQLRWKTEGGTYTFVIMTPTTGDSFSAYIPQQPDGTDLYYFIYTEDDSGRVENHPYIGAGNPHHFFVGPDTESPVVEFEPPSLIFTDNWPLDLTAYVLDNRWISSVSMEYMINGIAQDTIEMELQPLSAVYYDGTLTGAIEEGDLIEVRIKAVDTSINGNTTYDPSTGYYTIEVADSARTCVWNACGELSGEVFFEMMQRGGIQCFYTLEEPDDFNRFRNMFIFLGVWPNNYVLDESQEEAIVDYIDGGHNAYLEGADCWVYDPYNVELCDAFGIIGLEDGFELQDPLLGVDGTFTEGMSFDYTGLNNYIDQIEPAAGAELIFHHNDIGYGVANQNPSCRTAGLCFSFSGLEGNNTISSQANLFREIIHYFYQAGGDFAGLDEFQKSVGVSDMRIEIAGSDVMLNWSPLDEANYYVVCRSIEPYFSEESTDIIGFGPAGECGFIDIGALEDGTMFFYRVLGEWESIELSESNQPHHFQIDEAHRSRRVE
ncbi:MAG: agmatine deiminase family protein [candidate division Zixibacteria bacterium]|nr:agmatine deiminase family protein [Candidatus Tariuqbacter arcticus]